ncbi:MAG: biotin/lipoyl-binding protein [Chloroflexota bacterium]|nr:biotin/lipoyl-binding protein [Chloroflexota bacterium]
MSDYEVRIAGERVVPAEGWRLEPVDPARGIGRLVNGSASVPVVVEGSGADWVVTIRGRRIPVTVRSWRERILAEAETAAASHGGPVAVRATLPGLIVTVAVSVGDEVAPGDSLLTIEAMKMQNAVRAPRAGQVIEVSVHPGQTVATGAPLLRLE